MEQCRVERLAQSACGALAGTALAVLIAQLPVLYGTTGQVAALAALVLTIFASLKGWLPLVVNAATMIFLTVLTVPEIARHATPAGLFVGLAAGIVCFGGLGLLAALVIRIRAGKAAAADLSVELPAETRQSR